MTDFSGKLKANRNPEFHQQPAPPVPPDWEDPSKRTMRSSISTSVRPGECFQVSPGSTIVWPLCRQYLLHGKSTCSSIDVLDSIALMTEDMG